MRSALFSVCLVAAALALGGCAQQAPADEFGKQDVDQIHQLVQDFTTAYNAKDAGKIASLFAANASLMPPNRSTLHGSESVQSFFEGRIKDEGVTDVQVEVLTVGGHGPLGFVTGTFSLNLKGPDGASAAHDRGKVIWIVHKYSGQWRFDWQIFSSDLPPAGPAAAETPAKPAK